MRAIQLYLKTQPRWTEKNHIELSKAESRNVLCRGKLYSDILRQT